MRTAVASVLHRTTASTAAALLCVQLAGLLHTALVHHIECADGQLTEARVDTSVLARARPIPRAGASPGDPARELSPPHEHCAIPVHLRSARLLPSSHAVASIDAVAPVRALLELRDTAHALPPLDRAPKQSPPA